MLEKIESTEKTRSASVSPPSSSVGGHASPVAESHAAQRASAVKKESERSEATEVKDRATIEKAETTGSSERSSEADMGSLLSGLGSWSKGESEGDDSRVSGFGKRLPTLAKDEKTPEQQALEDIDKYGDIYDNASGGNRDGTISTKDLNNVASGNFDQDAARERLKDLGVSDEDMDETLKRLSSSAQYMLDNDDVRNQVDTANDRRGNPDGKISRGDISREIFRRQLEQARDGKLAAGPAASNRGDYEAVETSNAERTPAVIRQQELQILEAVNSGQPVSFTNANGQTEELTVRQLENTGGKAVYEMTGADGHTLRIESELGASENRTALARMADYYTQIPTEMRDSASTFELLRGKDESAAACFYSSSDKIVFYDGLSNLNEEVFDHEFAHGIGYQNDGLGEGLLDRFGQLFTGSDGEGAPGGWQEAIKSDGSAPSDYAKTNHKEDFAESWAAYAEARENGPDALKRLEEAYPARFAILEKLYEEGLA